MTGFARDDGSVGRYNWFWEVRSVNGRGRDIRLRLPPSHETLDPRCRALVARVIARGNCNLSLKIERITGDQVLKVNENALKQVARAIRKAEMFVDARQPTIDGILALRGVMELVEPEHSPDELDELNEAVLDSLQRALDKMVAARQEEGRCLQEAILGQVEQIERQLEIIRTSSSRSVDFIKERLQEQVKKILDTDAGLSSERLLQEAVLLAAKADIEEEIIRLAAHVSTVRSLLQGDGAVGRKLDFLAQELNREANTICSKSNAIDITNAGLEIKTLVDQMKEQVQNIE